MGAETRVTARDFNREPSRIKKAALLGPVIVTERGEPCVVVLSYQEYLKTRGDPPMSLLEWARTLPDTSDIDLDCEPPEPRQDWGFKIPDLD